jgi:hypothetical protein
METEEGFTHEGGWGSSASQFDNIYMSNKNSSEIYSILTLFLALALLIPPCYSQCCLSFTGGACVSCPFGMHLFRGNCLYDLTGCASYVGGFDCGGCRGNYQLANGSCWHASNTRVRQGFPQEWPIPPISQSICSPPCNKTPP